MSTIAVNAITDASGGNTASINGATPTTDNTMGRNRIINGDMRIDARNSGASVTPPSGNYTLDRWTSSLTQASKYSVQQNAGAVTPPVGFTNYLGLTSTSAYSVVSSDYFMQTQFIEGYNISDLGWGTADAKTVTLSFWVRSSLTGTFGGALNNLDNTRSYPFSYTVSAANTWEQKSITIAGDTTGTYNTTTGRGIAVRFALGVGSTYSGTAGSWSSNSYFSATGATSVVGTNGATFYITGVQLEAGSVATSFERVDYSEMLRRCMRYYEQILYGVSLGSGNGIISTGQAYSTTRSQSPYSWTTTKRAAPTIVLSPGADTRFYSATGVGYAATYTFTQINTQNCYINAQQNSGGNLVAGNASLLYAASGLAVQIDSEL